MQFQNQLVQDCQRVKPVLTSISNIWGVACLCLAECSRACSQSVTCGFHLPSFVQKFLLIMADIKSQLWRYEIHSFVITIGSHLRILLNIFEIFLLTKQYKMCSRRSSHEMSLSCLATTAVKGPTNNNQPTLVKNFFLAPAVAFEVWLLVTRVGCSG